MCTPLWHRRDPHCLIYRGDKHLQSPTKFLFFQERREVQPSNLHVPGKENSKSTHSSVCFGVLPRTKAQVSVQGSSK